MRMLPAVVLLLAATVLASCPLGFPPENACPESSPTCGLFLDADGDGLCDNPGPQPAGEEPDAPDTTAAEPDDPIDDPLVSVTNPDETGEDSTAEDDSGEPADTLSGAVSPDSASDAVQEADTACVVISCPLGYSPEQACPADSPSCALFRDDSGDGFCDNPGPRSDSTASTAADSTAAPVVIESHGCPRGLPSAAACPYERQLCPHWFGRWTDDTCANPSAGQRRAAFVLGITAVLLGLATVLSRRMRGGRKMRKKARATRITVLLAGFLSLGLLLQGCFCPLGTFQYALGISGLSFLGIVGISILALPILHALFFGRVYCGWVCPMGALQELLWRINILRMPQPGKRLDRALLVARTVIFMLFTGAVILAWNKVLDVSWPALFCSVDPFRAVFTLFLAGPLILGLALVVVSILWGRFFCRYLCFYGFVLGLACRAGLWTHLCRITGRKPGSCDSGGASASKTCEIGEKQD